MQTKRLAFTCSAMAVIVAALSASAILQVRANDSRGENIQSSQRGLDGPLLKVVRDSTQKYKNVSAAEKAGYGLLFGCVSGENEGAMGLHYVNMNLVGNPPLGADGQPDPTQPQIVVYEPQADGSPQIVGVDYLIIAEPWDDAHPGQGAPQIMGQLMQFVQAPNRYGLPNVYLLHVWAWRYNPTGPFTMWNPNVSCAAYNGQVK
ncbi:MAG: hypothetical protein ACREUT_04965 [Steroidobacteraceae bacterium]